MKTQINNYNDLAAAIATLTEDQKQQTPKALLLDGEDSRVISSIEITEEPFLQSKAYPDSAGYPEEMRREFGTCDAELFDVLEPIGTVYIYLSKAK